MTNNRAKYLKYHPIFNPKAEDMIILTGVAKGVNKLPIKIDAVVPMMKGLDLIFKIRVARNMMGLKMRTTETSSMIPETKALATHKT